MISIIIVGYNSKKYLDECLSSIFASTFKKFEVIFVDNCSKDGSVNYIKNNFPNVSVIENATNSGFTGGNNIGIQRAIENGSDYVFILNPDTVIDKNCLEILAKNADNKTIAQPLILLHENGEKTDLINTTGNYLNFLGISYCNNYRKPSSVAIDQDIPLASGAAALIPINAIKKAGMFDESFFMYHEDVDLFWRMRMAGYNIGLITSALVWHKYSFSKNKNKLFYVERNRIKFLLKNFNPWYWILIFPIFVVNEFLILIYSLKDGWFKLKIKSLIDAFKLTHSYKKSSPGNLSKIKRYLGYNLSFAEAKNILFVPYSWLLFLYFKLIYLLIF